MKTRNGGRGVELPDDFLERMAEALRILGHPARLRVIELLEAGEAPVHRVIERLGVAQSVASQHLNKMRRAGLIRAERRGKEIWYGIMDPDACTILGCIRKKARKL